MLLIVYESDDILEAYNLVLKAVKTRSKSIEGSYISIEDSKGRWYSENENVRHSQWNAYKCNAKGCLCKMYFIADWKDISAVWIVGLLLTFLTII